MPVNRFIVAGVVAVVVIVAVFLLWPRAEQVNTQTPPASETNNPVEVTPDSVFAHARVPIRLTTQYFNPQVVTLKVNTSYTFEILSVDQDHAVQYASFVGQRPDFEIAQGEKVDVTFGTSRAGAYFLECTKNCYPDTRLVIQVE
jgi:hypothetical protein